MRTHVAALAVLWLLALVVRFEATQERVSAGHGDVAAYYQVSRNLQQGRGFEQDFIADRLSGPTSLPTPSNTWWRPLPSVVGWLGMAIAGDASYTAGKRAMIVLSSFVPWVVYLAGFLLLRTRAAALAAGLLAVGFHLYLDQPNQLLSHGPYALFGGAALVLALDVGRTRRYLPWFGVLLGLAYLSRGDAQVLPLVLIVAVLAARFRVERWPIPWGRLATAAGLFALVVAPWWARNLQVYGELMPPGVSKVAFATTYEDWFTDPELLTWERYRAWGTDEILEQKQSAVAGAVAFVPFCMSESVDRGRDVEPGAPARRIHLLGLYLLGPLLWIGFVRMLSTRRRAALLVLLQIALLIAVYGIVFPAIGRNSFHSSLFSVYPFFLVCIVAAIELPLKPIFGERPRAIGIATVSIAALLGGLNIWAARPHLAAKYAGVEHMLEPYRELGAWVATQDLERPLFFCRNPWQLSTEARVGAVMIPSGDAEQIRRVAATFGVTHLVDEIGKRADLLLLRPGLEALFAGGELEQVPSGTSLDVYRLRPPE